MADPISGGTSLTIDLLYGVGGAVVAFATAWATFRQRVLELRKDVDQLSKDLRKLAAPGGRVDKLEKWRERNRGAKAAHQEIKRAHTGPIGVTGTHIEAADEDSGRWPDD